MVEIQEQESADENRIPEPPPSPRQEQQRPRQSAPSNNRGICDVFIVRFDLAAGFLNERDFRSSRRKITSSP